MAAGSGSRYGKPKQFEFLTSDERLVDQAVRTASAASNYVVLVLPAETDWTGAQVDQIVWGGSTRLASVAAGLEVVPRGFEWILIHDAAHPLASQALFAALIERLSDSNEPADAVVPVLDAVDLVKRRRLDGTLLTIGRENLGAAQVPMAFRHSSLAKAHAAADRPDGIREDSELLEHFGYRVVGIPGEVGNIHIIDATSIQLARRLV